MIATKFIGTMVTEIGDYEKSQSFLDEIINVLTLIKQALPKPALVLTHTPSAEPTTMGEWNDDFDANRGIAKGLEEIYYERIPEEEDSCFMIAIEDEDMGQVISKNKTITLVVKKDCWCYDPAPVGWKKPEPETRVKVVYRGKKITVQRCLEELVKSDWKCCSHCCLEGFGKLNSKFEMEVFCAS